MEIFRLFGVISLNKAEALKDLHAIEGEAEKSSSKMDKHFEKASESAEKWLKRGLAAAMAAVTGAMVLGVKAAADYETAMVELAKVTDPDTARTVAANIREMAKDMPLTHEALMGIAADAGRLGVEGVENIMNFTETVAQISVATDIMAEQAGTDFAKLLVLLGEDIDMVDELGSVINELSNNMAVTSSQIVDSMLRSSAALAGLDMGTGEIIALNAAMNEVSFSARVAGTALQGVAEQLKNPEKMKELAVALGITVDQFRALRDEDPVALFKQLALTLAEGGPAAEELFGILGDSASKLQALATNWAGVEEAIAMANEQMASATSLQTEYNTASDTFNNRVQVLRNNFHDIMIDVGTALIPTLDRFVVWMRDNTGEIQSLLTGIADGIAATLGWILEHRDGIAKALAVIGAGITALGLVSLIKNLSPIGALITVIAAAIAALLIYWDDVVSFFTDIGRAISGWVSGAWSSVKGFFGFGQTASSELAAGLRAGKEEVRKAIEELVSQDDAIAMGRRFANGFKIGFAQTTGTGASLATGALPSVEGLAGFTAGTDQGFTFAPDATSAWDNFWNRILEGTQGLRDGLKEAWGEISTIVGDAVGGIFGDTISGLYAQADAHKDAMKAIREQTEESLADEAAARDAALEALDQNLADQVIAQEQYGLDRQAILDAYDTAETTLLEDQKERLADEEATYEEQKKSIWEILKDSVRNVLRALKEELLVKAAASLAEAIAMTLGLNPLAGAKYLEAGAYAVGSAGLHIAGFEKGAVFKQPTLLPPHMVAEKGIAEAYLPLSRDVFSSIGRGIVDALSAPMPALAGASANGIQVDMRGLYDGATINVRDDQDISRIARETYDLWTSRMRGMGRDV